MPSAAILASLRPRLTTASLGLHWAPARVAGREYLKLSAADPVCLSVKGPLAILSSEPALMEDMLRRAGAQGSAVQARELAGFRHDQEGANLRRLAASLNVAKSNSQSGNGTFTASTSAASGPHPVDLFRDNLPSLSDAFQAMISEHFMETSDAGKVHQTVLYRWTGR